METDKNNRDKKVHKHGQPKPKEEPNAKHSSQGHSTDVKGTVTNTREATLRSATTDSTRVPKKDSDEGATGGNIR
ncbi:hypothetical protein POKO110462_08925 [Pontibacter korlensis]|uniref:Uncharacterized protein n=1 Tax=Pontibacter korlensis TaxID=400092 RepID=A0A0E3UVL8_9BACT|nr:hypothetical protein [Pontibacter korlensis]AKD02617.1 hypothetical protein PKOR_05125 [Pontibacter korlensis]